MHGRRREAEAGEAENALQFMVHGQGGDPFVGRQVAAGALKDYWVKARLLPRIAVALPLAALSLYRCSAAALLRPSPLHRR